MRESQSCPCERHKADIARFVSGSSKATAIGRIGSYVEEDRGDGLTRSAHLKRNSDEEQVDDEGTDT
jgi:hypothetical protein